jgi:hypothetical protein
MPPIHLNGDAHRTPDALPAARRVHSTRAFETVLWRSQCKWPSSNYGSSQTFKGGAGWISTQSAQRTQARSPIHHQRPRVQRALSTSCARSKIVLCHLLRDLPCSRAKPTRHIWTPGIPIRNIWSRGIPIHHCWIGRMIYMRRLRPPPGHWWPPEKAQSWPRLFGQRPAGFKWIPAGLC